jgi:hypothetical protein
MVTVLRVGKAVWAEHVIFRDVVGREQRRLDGDGEGKPAGTRSGLVRRWVFYGGGNRERLEHIG